VSDVYHGIILDAEFDDPNFVNQFNIFSKRNDVKNGWICFGIETEASKLQEVIDKIQSNLRSDAPFYAHLYNGKELIVVFKEKVFRMIQCFPTDTPVEFCAPMGKDRICGLGSFVVQRLYE